MQLLSHSIGMYFHRCGSFEWDEGKNMSTYELLIWQGQGGTINVCPDGFTGTTCVEIDYCFDVDCLNGGKFVLFELLVCQQDFDSFFSASRLKIKLAMHVTAHYIFWRSQGKLTQGCYLLAAVEIIHNLFSLSSHSPQDIMHSLYPLLKKDPH